MSKVAQNPLVVTRNFVGADKLPQLLDAHHPVEGKAGLALRPFGAEAPVPLPETPDWKSFAEFIGALNVALGGSRGPVVNLAVQETGLFGDARAVAKRKVRGALQSRTDIVEPVLPESFPDLALMAEAFAEHSINDKMGIAGRNYGETVGDVSHLYFLESEAMIAAARDFIPDHFLDACEALCLVPPGDVTLSAIGYYAGEGAAEGEREEVRTRRLRAAAACPPLAGYIARSLTLTEVVDSEASLTDAIAEFSKGRITRPVFNRLAKTQDARALDMMIRGAFDGFPPDQIPSTTSAWDAAIMLWGAVGELAAKTGVGIDVLWTHQRFSYSRGKWEEMAAAVYKKFIDKRPPHNAGIARDHIEAFRSGGGFRDIKPHENPLVVASQINEAGIKAAVAAGANPDTIDARQTLVWILSNHWKHIDTDVLAAGFQKLGDAANVFGLQSVLPAALAEMHLQKLPITGEMISASATAALQILIDPNVTITSVAEIGERFFRTAPLLAPPPMTQKEILAKGGADAEPELQHANVSDAIAAFHNDMLERFQYQFDVPQWEPMSPAFQASNGLVVIPLCTMQQVYEEGHFGEGEPDRCGVGDLNVCIGIRYAPLALSSRGARQAISFRRLKDDGSYERVAAATISLQESNGSVTFEFPVFGHFNGPSNCTAPKSAKSALEEYRSWIINNPHVVPKDLIKIAKEGGAAKEQGVQVRITRIDEITGQPNSCASYKILSVLDTWKANGILSEKFEYSPEVFDREAFPVVKAIKEELKKAGIAVPDMAPTASQSALIRSPLPAKPKRPATGVRFY